VADGARIWDKKKKGVSWRRRFPGCRIGLHLARHQSLRCSARCNKLGKEFSLEGLSGSGARSGGSSCAAEETGREFWSWAGERRRNPDVITGENFGEWRGFYCFFVFVSARLLLRFVLLVVRMAGNPRVKRRRPCCFAAGRSRQFAHEGRTSGRFADVASKAGGVVRKRAHMLRNRHGLVCPPR